MKELLIALTLAVGFVCTQAHAAGWDYATKTDAMTGKSGQYATLTSKDSLRLDFPYKGDNYTSITVRHHSRYGVDVYVSIWKGQMPCYSFGKGCQILIRFGDGQPVTFDGISPDDSDTRVVFVQNPQKFITLAKSAKSIKVQLPIYKAGGTIAEFDTATPLVWDTPAAKPQSKASEEAKKVEAKKQEAKVAAQNASGPSASYGGKVRAKVKPNIVFTEDIAGNPTAEVEVRTALDGRIISQRLIKPSGSKVWDEAVIKAIIRTETMPRDVDGRVPSPMILEFRPRD